jgi:transposase
MICSSLNLVFFTSVSSRRRTLAQIGRVSGEHVSIRAVGARLLFLPPYSPDLNPIEQVFAKLKHLMRKAAERSHEATWRRVGTLLDAFSPAECRNYLVNSGYGSA